MDTASIRKLEDAHLLETYRKFPIALATGRGLWVTDVEGRKYLDLYGGHAVAITGHCHPHVVAALREQSERLLFYSNLVYLDVRAVAAARLADFAPEGMKAYFCNSGAEANETALKIARRLTGRPAVVAMENSFHGRTLAAISATHLSSYREQAGPLVPGTRFVPMGDVGALERAVGPGTAAVIMEPIQSMAGVIEPEQDYFRAARRICDRRGALLIFDEVQTAPGRTGARFYGEHPGVAPDLITTAKGIASGVPCGLVLCAAEVAAKVRPGEQGSTFGGGPLACAALAATLEVIGSEGLVENAARMGAVLAGGAAALPGVAEVRGRGLLLGIALDRAAAPVRDALLERRILVSTAPGDDRVLRLLPPLTISPEECGIFLKALGEVLEDVDE